MSEKILNLLFLFVVGTIGGIFADQILWPYFIEKPLFSEYRLEQTPIYVTERKEVTVTEDIALQDAVAKVESIVVGIRTVTVDNVIVGSGLIVTSDGLFVTLNDLVPRDSELSFFIDGKSVSFQILKRDAVHNLALVKVEKNNLPTVSFADLKKIKLGQRIFLIGVVFDGKGVRRVVNEGLIRSFDEEAIETNVFESVVLAGSPLFDIKGSCLGLSQINPQGRVIAIPIDQVKHFIGL